MTLTSGAGPIQLECELEGIDLPRGEYELGDGIELSMVPADRQGKLKFEFERMYGRLRDLFILGEEASRCLVEHTREIDVCLLRCERTVLQLSGDVTLATCATASGERYVQLRANNKDGGAGTFELTYAAWTHLADTAKQMMYDADAFRLY
jgi:hypothetical protein